MTYQNMLHQFERRTVVTPDTGKKIAPQEDFVPLPIRIEGSIPPDLLRKSEGYWRRFCSEGLDMLLEDIPSSEAPYLIAAGLAEIYNALRTDKPKTILLATAAGVQQNLSFREESSDAQNQNGIDKEDTKSIPQLVFNGEKEIHMKNGTTWLAVGGTNEITYYLLDENGKKAGEKIEIPCLAGSRVEVRPVSASEAYWNKDTKKVWDGKTDLSLDERRSEQEDDNSVTGPS